MRVIYQKNAEVDRLRSIGQPRRPKFVHTRAPASGTACVGGGCVGIWLTPSTSLPVSKLAAGFSAIPSAFLACVDIGPNWSMCASECHSSTVLKNVKTIPGHRNTTLAIARPLLAYLIGLPLYSRRARSAVVESTPVTYALFAATMYVYASAQESVSAHARTEQARHAIFTARDSRRSGQKRSKKKAAPKMVATKMPTKMLYEAMPMKLMLCMVAPGAWVATYFCWST
jgi:hypothetical protein